jgi:hypothetical protein
MAEPPPEIVSLLLLPCLTTLPQMLILQILFIYLFISYITLYQCNVLYKAHFIKRYELTKNGEYLFNCGKSVERLNFSSQSSYFPQGGRYILIGNFI